MVSHIGIGITTKNRESSFNLCLSKHLEFLPPKAEIFIVDDGSDPCYAPYDLRHIESKGIASSKNACLKLMYEAGCTEFWLFDDDSYPLCNDWHLPYLKSGQHHLCRTFYKPYKTEGNLNVFRAGNGMAMFYTRYCIDTVGGFDTRFKNKYEHTSMSQRIFNAGLTPYAFMDVIDSDKLIYSMDEFNEIERSFTNREMQDNLRAGYEYFNQQRNSSAFIEFRT